MANQVVVVDIVNRFVQLLGSAAPPDEVLSVENDYHKLKHTISLIKSVVDAEKLHNRDAAVRDWLEKLKDIVCDADDLLDDLFTHELRRNILTRNKRAKKVRIFFSLSNQHLFRHKLSCKVETVLERLDDIERIKINLGTSTDRPVHRIEELITHTHTHTERHPFVDDQEWIGRDADRKAIIELLVEESDVRNNVSVVAIVGMGGMGKTTLAQSVYSGHEVGKHFELRIWVTVPLLDVRQIAEKIIEIKTGSNPKSLSLEALQSHLRREFDGKKYLLVLDDVWNEDPVWWRQVRDLLMGGAKGSKILLTTRNQSVADAADANPRYLLNSLSSEESWALFAKIAFKGGKGLENPRLVNIGQKIVRKLGGLPLAITVVGNTLLGRTEREWLEFTQTLKTENMEDNIYSVLKISYDALPTDLMQCFKLCSIYPEDHVFDKQQMVQLWIAHEFIPLSSRNGSLEDVGDSYVRNLEKRAFLSVERDENSDTIISFKLHDLIHDLAEKVSGTKHFMNHLSGEDLEKRMHHVAFNSFNDSSSENPSCQERSDNIGTCLLSYPYHENFISIFKSLRSLDMHNLRMKMVPGCVGKLKYLRFLDLSENDIKTLPSSVTKLQNLQTLKLSDCEDLEELPEDIGKLVSLRHLELESCYGLKGMPFGLGHLTSLHTLPLFITGPGSRLSELKGLNNLHDKLKIELRSSESEVVDGILKEKSHLKSLELNFRHYDNDDELVLESLQPHPNLEKLDIRWYGGENFPTWMRENIHSVLPNLVTITLLSCYRWEHLPQLGQLTSLESLELSSLTSLRYIEENSTSVGGESRTTFFKSLKYLSLVDLPNLKGWWSREEPTITETATEQQQLPSFPCLSRSYLRNCPKMESMPLQPSSVELKLDGVSAKLVQQQLSMANPAIDVLAPSSSSSSPLPRLEILYINDIEDLVSLPDEAFQSLTSLWKLWICNCRTLTSLPRGMQYLVALKSLRIHNCQELDLLDADDDNGGGGIPFLGLKNLTSLELSQIPKLVSLPAGLQHLNSLQSLSISRCENLTTLKRITKLASLKQLSVSLCPRLMLLPKRMHMLAALQQLKIEKCSKVLYERYNKDTGKYWPRIEHIPDVLVKE